MKKFRTTHKKVLSLLLVMIMLVSIAPANLFSVTASAVSGSEIVAYARQFLGYQYVYGTAGPNTFDCSGFTKYVFGHFGISLPHSTYTLWNNSTSYGTVVATGSTANAKAGDLILWEGHVAIYTENGYCVEALNENYDVTDKVAVNSHSNGMNYKVIRVYGVSDDTSKPTISNVYASNVSGSTFTINCTLNDDVGVTRVWLNIYGPNGSDGYAVNASSGNFSHTISTSKYGGSGLYSVHIYAFDAAGNETSYGLNNINAIDDKEKPTISNAYTSKVSGDSFTINCTLNDDVGVTRVWLNIYGPDGSDGYSVNATSGDFSHTISTSNYGGSGLYSVHIYAFDASGKETGYGLNNIYAYDSFSITYNPNGGENAPEAQSKKYDEVVTLTASEPVRDGYNFLGWSTDSNATEPEYLPGDTYSENKDITLYAVWEKAVNEYTIKGALKTFGNSDDEILVDFYKPGESESCGYTIFRGDAEEFCIGGIQQGEYIIKISKPNHVTREYSVVVDKDIELDIQLNLIGDVDGNGKVNITDYNAILRHVKKTGALDGYAFDCADVDGNSRIMVTDYNAVLRHVKKIETLW